MPTDSHVIELSLDELREVAGFAARCAGEALPIFEGDMPGDPRPREAIGAALAFAEGGPRTNGLRSTAWAAFRAAQSAATDAASEAAHAASAAAGAAFLHPLAQADQVKHILGSAARSAHAAELDGGEGPPPAEARIEGALREASSVVIDVLNRYPAAPPGGGRVGELMRLLDSALRGRA
jgi:hypothetical protein